MKVSLTHGKARSSTELDRLIEPDRWYELTIHIKRQGEYWFHTAWSLRLLPDSPTLTDPVDRLPPEDSRE